LLVGAFPYPQNHGSQIYFQEQAIALRSLGAEITLLTYGTGRPPPRLVQSTSTDRLAAGQRPEARSGTIREIEVAEYWRVLDGFEHFASPKWTSPASLRSGPSWAKPLADFGLIMTLRNALASQSRHNAFDAILTHNGEATLAALRLLPRPRPPIIYCAHTLLGKELSTYLKCPKKRDFSNNSIGRKGLGATSWVLDRIGSRIDRLLASGADGWIALTRSAECVMRHFSDAPGALIAPAVPDPLLSAHAVEAGATARANGLEPGRFFLYSGNLDAYQEVDILAAVARSRAVDAGPGRGRDLPLVIASHSPRSTSGRLDAPSGIEFLQVDSLAEMQALLASARASLLMRRTEGGFPIKLVNSLAVGTPAIAFHGPEWGLEHEHNSLICSPERPALSMAAAIDRLQKSDDLRARLARGARSLYLDRHQPVPTATQTLELVEEVCRRHRSG